MDLTFTPAEEAFRAEVRQFFADKLPRRFAERERLGLPMTKTEQEEWQAILNAQGWLAPHWPVEWGGTGWSIVERYIFDLEGNLAYAPRVVPFGFSMLAPVLLKYGSEAQKSHWLPRMLAGDDWWCQGYSEPGAGSDLAALKTRAVRDGDHYVVNGQKTWTTLGQHANMIFALVRTADGPRRQEGISFLLIDMTSPGIEVRPIITLDGEHEVNEIFFTDVRVPAENLVGEENRGWTYAKYLLTHERTSMSMIGASTTAIHWLKGIAQHQTRGGRPLLDDPLFAARLARIEIELANLSTTTMRVLAAAAAGGAPGPESSMLKIKGTELRQEISSLTRRALGPHAQPFLPESLEDGHNDNPVGPPDAAAVTPTYLNLRKLSIYGGSNEIQKNIISKMILQL
ncbi:MAG: acyl-CoA dehydrogenase family protein [Pseudomonadota bacterium]|nr:acyl-CoA dehydrogenase family protein [Pseudomonadota bacterium]